MPLAIENYAMIGDRHTAACHFTDEIAAGELARTDHARPAEVS